MQIPNYTQSRKQVALDLECTVVTVVVWLLSRVQLFATPGTAARFCYKHHYSHEGVCWSGAQLSFSGIAHHAWAGGGTITVL